MRATRESNLELALRVPRSASRSVIRTPVSRRPVSQEEETSVIASSRDDPDARWLSLNDATTRSRTLSNGKVQDANRTRQKT